MSADIDELMTRIATLEAERDALLETIKPRSKKDRKEERRVSAALASVEQKNRRLTHECDRFRRSTDDGGSTLASRAIWPRRAGIAGLAVCALPLAYSYAMGSDDVRWVKTTCSAREIVAFDGESLGTVSIPELRPEWQIDSTEGEAGPCWIPVPETVRAIIRFSEPTATRVSRWEQIGYAPRVLSVLLFWGSIALLYIADAMRRGVKLLPDQSDED